MVYCVDNCHRGDLIFHERQNCSAIFLRRVQLEKEHHRQHAIGTFDLLVVSLNLREQRQKLAGEHLDSFALWARALEPAGKDGPRERFGLLAVIRCHAVQDLLEPCFSLDICDWDFEHHALHLGVGLRC